jgi:hypothetical protein
MSPLSETTILVPSLVGGVTTAQHIRAMTATVGPSILISLVLFFLISLTTDVAASTAEIEAARATLAEAFNISLVCLLPLVLLIAFSIIKFPAFLSIFLTAIFSGVLAIFTQPDLVIRFAGDPDLSKPLAYIKGIYAAMATGFVSSTGIEAIDSLFSRGGMSGMLSTVWLILGALGFGAIMERAGFLDKLVSSVLARAKSGGALVATVMARPWSQHHRGRPVHRHRSTLADVPTRVQAARLQTHGALTNRRGLGDRHFRTHSVEHLWRLSHRSAGHFDFCVLPVLLLQYHQPHLVIDIRIHGLPHGEVRARRGAPGR